MNMDAITRLRGVLFTLAAALALCFSGCADGARECYPYDWQACDCPGGAQGYQQCDVKGSAYGSCDCSGYIPGISTSASSGGADGGDEGGGKLPFMADCTKDEECESGLCFPFNAKGPHCTISCDPSTACPPPSPGCSGMGVCKTP